MNKALNKVTIELDSDQIQQITYALTSHWTNFGMGQIGTELDKVYAKQIWETLEYLNQIRDSLTA